MAKPKRIKAGLYPGPATRVKVGVKKKRTGGGGGHGGGGIGNLYNPSSTLSGRKLKKASNALTRIELLPALRSYQRQEAELEAQRAGTQAGLEGLGQRTGAAVGAVYDTLKGSSDQTVARQQALASALNQNTQNVNTQAQQALQASQTGELGGLTEALKSRNIEPGGSASQQALAKQVEAQQNAAAERAKGYGAFAQAQGGAFSGLAAAQSQAEQMRGREAQSGIHQAILDRIAESNADFGSDIREARGKRADTKALWGPTRIKNLLQLRGSEREWMGSQQASSAKQGYNKAITKVAKLGLQGKKVSAGAQLGVAQTQQGTQKIKNKGFKNLPSGGSSGGKRKRRP